VPTFDIIVVAAAIGGTVRQIVRVRISANVSIPVKDVGVNIPGFLYLRIDVTIACA